MAHVRLGVAEPRRGPDFHRLSERTNLQTDVMTDRGSALEQDSRGHSLLEPGQVDGDRIGAQHQRGRSVGAGFIGHEEAVDTGRFVANRDSGPRDGRTLRIADDAADGGAVGSLGK